MSETQTQPRLFRLTQADAEAALAAGRINGRISGNRWWKVRRNGKTKTWKTRPGHYQIPVKAGLRICGYLDHTVVLCWASVPGPVYWMLTGELPTTALPPKA